MFTHTESQPNSVHHHVLDEQFDSLKSSIKKLVERATTKPTWFGRAVGKTEDTIKAHPIAAVGAALGLGYVFMRVWRR